MKIQAISLINTQQRQNTKNSNYSTSHLMANKGKLLALH